MCIGVEEGDDRKKEEEKKKKKKEKTKKAQGAYTIAVVPQVVFFKCAV